MPFNSWFNKLCNHTTEYYFSNKKNKQLIHITTWMDLQRIHWMKKVKPERLHTVWFHLCDSLLKSKCIGTENRFVQSMKIYKYQLCLPTWYAGASKVLVPQLLPHCKYIKKYYQKNTSDSDSKHSGHGILRKPCTMEYMMKGECSGHLEEGEKWLEHGTHFIYLGHLHY